MNFVFFFEPIHESLSARNLIRMKDTLDSQISGGRGYQINGYLAVKSISSSVLELENSWSIMLTPTHTVYRTLQN